MSAASTLGVDLGTTWTAAALQQGGRVDPLPLGSDTLVYGHLAGNGTGARVAVRLHQSVTARTGHLSVRYDPAMAHYFDPASGKRIEA